MTPEIDYANATHPFLDGAPKRMLIGGHWVAAASGKTFETRNPATGELLAVVPEGDREDIDRAVAAARAAFEGPWRRMKPDERAALMHALADVVDAHYDELAWLDTLDMGSPIRHTRGSRRHLVGLMRYFAGQATAIHGLTAETSLNGDMFAATLKEPVGVVGAIIPWNGPLWATVFKTAPVLATGCTLVLNANAEPAPGDAGLWDLVDEAGISVLGVHGDWLNAAAASEIAPQQSHRLLSLKTLLVAGTPPAPEAYDFAYQRVKDRLLLAPVLIGADTLACFALGAPVLPVVRGEVPCRALGMRIEVLDADGAPVVGEPGELVCSAPFPSLPLGFADDADGARYLARYFSRHPGRWSRGERALLTTRDSLVPA